MKKIKSEVKGFQGICSPTWINKKKVEHLLDEGISGFFKKVKEKKILGIRFYIKVGEEFHGIIQNNVGKSNDSSW